MSRRREAVRKALEWIERNQAIEHYGDGAGSQNTGHRGRVEDWQTTWAETTLDVVKNVWWTAGARMYRSQGMLYDDLYDWLLVEAQKVANSYQPRWDAAAPERAWGAYLIETLRNRARWHFATTIGANNAENREAHSQIANLDSRIEAMIHRATPGQEMHIIGSTRPMLAWVPMSPEAHVLLVESLTERLTSSAEELADGDQCAEDGCTRSRARGRPGRYCEHHYRRSLTWWGDGPRCAEAGCPDAASTRGYCPKHYRAEWARRRRTGDPWEPVTYPDTCTLDGCDEPHSAKGMCKRHYLQHRAAQLPACTVDGCDKRQASRGLCSTHYKQLRAREKGEAA